MQSSGSITSTQHAHSTPFRPIHRRQGSPYGTALQDANAAGRPFAFVPKRRSSSGSMGGATRDNEAGDVCSSLQQGKILLVEEPKSEGPAGLHDAPRAFFTFPCAKPEVVRGRLPRFDDESGGHLSEATTPISTVDLELVDTASAIAETPPLPHLVSVGSGFSAPPGVLIRKKSGELVKPSLKSSGFATWAASSPGRPRTKSAPSTPLEPKFVHFDAHLEHVKLFLAEQKPLAVSRDGSPTETSEGETTDTGYPFPTMALRIKPITLPSPPLEPWTFDVRFEKVALEETALVGHVLVRNIAFAKWVAVRFTLDSWQTTSEVTARHVASLREDTFDRFEFRIRLVDYLNGIESKRLVICVRYSAEGREMWDNNEGRNYELGFERGREGASKRATAPRTPGRKTGPALAADLRKQLEKVSQEGQHGDYPTPSTTTVHSRKPRGLRVWLGDRVLGDEDGPSPPPRPRSRSESPVGDKNNGPMPSLRNADASLSARYDFGASLKSPTWTPPPPVFTKPFTSTPTTSKPKATRQCPKSPPLAAATTSTSVSQLLGAGEHRRRMTIPLDGGFMFSPRAALPRGSPRDSADYADEGVGELRRLNLENNAPDEDDRPRRHTRGWAHGTAYFDRVAADAPALKTTPPGSFMVIPPTPPKQGTASHLGRKDSRRSSSRSRSLSPSAPHIPLDNVWCTLRPSDDESFASTPSITTSTSSPTTLSPLYSPEYLPRAASDDTLTVGTTTHMSRAKRPPIGSAPYYSFLDQFCFYTGVGTYHSPSYSGPDVGVRQETRPTSNMEDYFTFSPPLDDDIQYPQSPDTTTPTSSSVSAGFMSNHTLATTCPGTPADFSQSVLSTPVAG